MSTSTSFVDSMAIRRIEAALAETDRQMRTASSSIGDHKQATLRQRKRLVLLRQERRRLERQLERKKGSWISEPK